MPSRIVRFSIKGVFQTELAEDLDLEIVWDLQEKFKVWFETMKLQGETFIHAEVDEVDVTIDTPKSADVKAMELCIIRSLALAFQEQGLTPELAPDDRPAILSLNGRKTERYDNIAYVEWDEYDLDYELRIAAYKSNGEHILFSRSSVDGFDFNKIAARVKNYFITHGLLEMKY